MKKIGNNFVAVILAVVLVPLILGFLLLMPVEFCVSSWQLAQLESQTVGEVLESKVSYSGHRTSRSEVRYRYTVEGKEYFSTRIRVGFLGNGYESAGGDIATGLKPGMRIPVYYAKARPERAVLAYGWPKWSIGFSLGVWGIILGRQTRGVDKGLLVYVLSKATMWSGFVCIFFFWEVFYPRDWLSLAGVAFVVAAASFLWGLYARRIRKRAPSA
jgi:hypothetical protein